MMVEVKTFYPNKVPSQIEIENKDIENTKDKFIGRNNTDFEERNSEYIRRRFGL